MMQTETSVTADARVSVPRALKNGSVVVALSSVIWGLGCFVRKQFVKGALLLAAEVGIILYMISSGFYNLTKLITLGDVEQQKVWNEAKSIFEYVDGDRSLVILLYGIVTVAILLCGVLLIRLSIKSAYQAEQIALIRRIHDQMMSDMSQRCTIEMLSQQYHINTSTLKSLFKTVYGQPLAAHMKEHRMEHAARLLRTTTDSLAEIAEKVGYESQSKLTAAFKSAYGVLPSEYRKEKKENSRP